MPSLSIITVTHNRAEVLKNNIASVLSQTFTDIEHIVVDNMSKDDTEHIVQEYQQTALYPVIYIREPDMGMYNAMNKGLKQASGVWTHILNSDDQYADPSVLSGVFALDIDSYDLIASAIFVVEAEHPERKLLWRPEFNRELHHYNFPHPGIILKKQFYERHGYYDESYRIASDAMHGTLHYAKALYLILDAPLVVMANSGMSNQPSLRNLYESSLTVIAYHKFPLHAKVLIIVQYLASFLTKSAAWLLKATRIACLGKDI